jgi:hypothetical protein
MWLRRSCATAERDLCHCACFRVRLNVVLLKLPTLSAGTRQRLRLHILASVALLKRVHGRSVYLHARPFHIR